MKKKKQERPVISNHDTMVLLKELGACYESQDFVAANPDLDLDQLWTRCKNRDWKEWLAEVTVGYDFLCNLKMTSKRRWCTSCRNYSCLAPRQIPTEWSRRKLKKAVFDFLTA